VWETSQTELDIRMPMPRRTYTQARADYIIEVFEALRDNIDDVTGMEITWEPASLENASRR
jgi:tryptophanase